MNDPIFVQTCTTGRAEWLSVAALAERLDVRVDHLRALVARREIPFGRVGRLVRFHWPTVQRWVEEGALQGDVKTKSPSVETGID